MQRAGRREVGDKLGNVLFLLCRRDRSRFLLGGNAFHAAPKRFHDVDDFAATFRSRRCNGNLFAFALFIQHRQHPDPVLVFIILRSELFGRKLVDETDA